MFAPGLNSLIFDCEVSLPVDDGAQTGAMDGPRDAHLVGQRLELLCGASCPFTRELQRSTESILLASGTQDCQAVGFLARCLASLGYIVSVRAALSGVGADCFKSLRHEFLVVRGTGEFRGLEFIVEPSLRQHFSIPHPSPEYDYVLSRTPNVFVGRSCHLTPIVQLLCALMVDSFQRQGLPLPPWRREAAMLSKWLPQPHRTKDTPVLPPPKAAAAAVQFSPAEAAADAAVAAVAAAATLSRQTVPQPPPHEATQAAVCDPSAIDLPVVCRADSSGVSTGSSGGFEGCCVPLGGSPVSVLRLPGIAAGYLDGVSHGGRVTAAAAPTATARKAPAVQRGFEPLVPTKVAAPMVDRGMAEAVAPASRDLNCRLSEASEAVAIGPTPSGSAREEEHRRIRSSSCNSRSGSYSFGGSVGDDDVCSSASGLAGSEGSVSRTGMLSVQIQVQQLQQQAVSAAVSATTDADGRILTRPPMHQGEMAIRVVKPIGLSLPNP